MTSSPQKIAARHVEARKKTGGLASLSVRDDATSFHLPHPLLRLDARRAGQSDRRAARAMKYPHCAEIGCRRQGWHGCNFCVDHTYPRSAAASKARRTYDRRMALEVEISRVTAALRRKLAKLEDCP